MAKKKGKKVIRYRRPLNINVGMIIFFTIFICLIFSVYMYLKQKKIQFYGMVDDGIVNNRVYNGLILREKQVRTADRSGYIGYYLREERRVSVGSHIYSLDETGNLKALLKENAKGGIFLSDDSLPDLKEQLASSALSFQNRGFGTVYDARISFDASMMEYSSFSTLDQLDKFVEQSGAAFEQVRPDVSDVVSYGIDSFESMTTSNVDVADFSRGTYIRTIHKSGDLVDSGSPAYKVVISEKWSIVFPLSDGDAALYNDKTALRIVFRDYSLNTPAAYSTFTGKGGATYGKLDFSKYMEQLVSNRSAGFEVKVNKTDGLRIPISAIADKNFYLIPLEYMTQSDDSSKDGFYKEVYTESGTSIAFVPIAVHYSDGEFYYVDMRKENGFRTGSYMVRPESSDRYQIGRTVSLKGVYSINKDYTIFKQIDILDSNSEYCTVRKSMRYDLSVYDHIVLGASMVEEGQLLYQ